MSNGILQYRQGIQNNHQIEVTNGLFADEASEQIRAFFRMLRARGEK